MKLAVGLVLFFLGVAQFARFSWGQTSGTTYPVGSEDRALGLSSNAYAVFGATPQQESLIRSDIQIMRPAVLPLRVFFVPHWKYVNDTRIFRLHVPTGYTSALFTHLPSRTVFIGADRYINDESLGYWLAHELSTWRPTALKRKMRKRPPTNFANVSKTYRIKTYLEVADRFWTSRRQTGQSVPTATCHKPQLPVCRSSKK